MFFREASPLPWQERNTRSEFAIRWERTSSVVALAESGSHSRKRLPRLCSCTRHPLAHFGRARRWEVSSPPSPGFRLPRFHSSPLSLGVGHGGRSTPRDPSPGGGLVHRASKQTSRSVANLMHANTRDDVVGWRGSMLLTLLLSSLPLLAQGIAEL
jgi:hypothetical protein